MKKRNLSLYVFYVMLALGMIEELSDDVITGCKNMDVLLKKTCDLLSLCIDVVIVSGSLCFVYCPSL